MVKSIFKAYKKTDKIFLIFLLYTKMTNIYYQKHKEKLQKEGCERYQNLYGEEKDKNHQYARERYKNLSEEEKEKKRQYGRERCKNLLEDD